MRQVLQPINALKRLLRIANISQWYLTRQILHQGNSISRKDIGSSIGHPNQYRLVTGGVPGGFYNGDAWDHQAVSIHKFIIHRVLEMVGHVRR